MAKTKSKKLVSKYRRISIGIPILAIILIVGFSGYWEIIRYKINRDQIEMVTTRELIISAIDNLNQPAVKDPKTGDLYFPPSKLYLPYTNDHSRFVLVYSYYDFDPNDIEFTISNRFVLGNAQSKLYTAQNISKLFDELPQAQACARGLRITYEKLSDESNLKLNHSFVLNNGKMLFIYSEKACPQLDSTAEMLKNLRSY